MSLKDFDLLNLDDDPLPTPTVKPMAIENNNNTDLPLEIAKCIALNLPSIQDILNFSLVNKVCHEAVYKNESLWIKNLRLLGLWDKFKYKTQHEKSKSLQDFELNLDPINCFNKENIIYNKSFAFTQFKLIYQQIYPIFKDLIIVNRSNFANSKYLKQYNTPESQAVIFNNLSQFLKLYQSSTDQNYYVRLNTIVDIFTNSVLKEIETNFDSHNHKECLRFVKVLSKLNVQGVTSTLDLVLEFFIDRYIEDFNFLNTEETIDSCFYRKTNKTRIDFDKITEIFKKINSVLTNEFNEVSSIFHSDPNYIPSSNEINEVPILLKIVENFLQNVMISKFAEDLITRASYIDEKEEKIEEIQEVQEVTILEPLDEEDEQEQEDETAEEANEWSEVANAKPITEPVSQDKEEKHKETGLEEMHNAALYFQIVPYLYRKIIELFDTIDYPVSVIINPNESQPKEAQDEELIEVTSRRKSSVGSKPIEYKKIAVELVDFYYEQFLSDFIGKLPKQCNILLGDVVNNWKLKQQQQEVSEKSQILNLVTSDDNKNKNFLKLDIFTGFSKIFKVGNTINADEVENTEHKTFTKNEANLKILTANLNNIKSLISLDLAITLLKTLKENTQLLLSLTGRGGSKENKPKRRVGEFQTSSFINEDLKHRVNITCQEMFNDMLNILMEAHIRSGFDKALLRLRNYKPSDLKNTVDNTVDPIINFIELVNVGDLIQQMISVFYREELINTKIVVQKHKTKRDFLMANKCEKSMRKFESLLDNYVADGLNISIDVLMSEISYGIMTLLDGADFNITEKDLMEKNIDLGSPSKLGQKILEILKNHINLLTGSIDKTIVDVFQQEIGERFVTILVKLITKDLVISTTGAITLISDLNAYYKFFLEYRIKPVLAYFTALKSISQLYLIDSSNSKDIGKLVVKIGRENGIFNQEEIYEFVTRRADWDIIKKDVDRIMYGLGLTDCTIM